MWCLQIRLRHAFALSCRRRRHHHHHHHLTAKKKKKEKEKEKKAAGVHRAGSKMWVSFPMVVARIPSRSCCSVGDITQSGSNGIVVQNRDICFAECRSARRQCREG